jgi:hypothetical protein
MIIKERSFATAEKNAQPDTMPWFLLAGCNL